METIEELKKQLAESQAREVILRECLNQIYNSGNDCSCTSEKEFDSTGVFWRCHHCLAGDALATEPGPLVAFIERLRTDATNFLARARECCEELNPNNFLEKSTLWRAEDALGKTLDELEKMMKGKSK